MNCMHKLDANENGKVIWAHGNCLRRVSRCRTIQLLTNRVMPMLSDNLISSITEQPISYVPRD